MADRFYRQSIDQVWLERHQELLTKINKLIDESQPPDVPEDHANRELLLLQELTNTIKQVLNDYDHIWDAEYDRRR